MSCCSRRCDSVRRLDETDLAKAGWPLSPWFKSLCERSEWTFDVDTGWRVPLPLAIGETLRTALLEFNPAPDVIETHAARIYLATHQGRLDEHAHNRPATKATSDRQIERLHDLCGRLAQHLEAMNRPAIDSLRREGLDGAALAELACLVQERCQHAFGGYDDERSTGRPPAVEAQETTAAVADAFQRIAGKRPTYTTDPHTGERRGLWPDTVRAVFRVLHIPASVESQVKAYADAHPPGGEQGRKAPLE